MSTQLLIDETGHIDQVSLKGDCVRPGCLGQLKGPICEWKDSTRNDHYYTHNHWIRVFNLPWVKEAMETKTLFGEADHPKDRVEAKLTKAAVVLTDYEERIDEMDYFGTFDILDTPCGRILRTLAEYGCKLGVSSRGKGSLKKINGRNTVDENSYIFGGFDVVALPAVKKARQDFIAESVDFDSMTDSIKSQIDECSDISELNIMKDMLSRNDSFKPLVESIDAKIIELSPQIQPSTEPDNTIIEGLTKDLKSAYDKITAQESLISKYENSDLTNTISIEESMDNLKLINELLQENQSCHEVIKSLQSEISSKTEMINKLQYTNVMSPSLRNHNKMIGLSEQVTELRDVLRAKSRKLSDNSKLIEELTNELQTTRDTVAELKEEISINESENDSISDELDQTKLNLSSMSERYDKVSQELSDKESELEASNTRIDELEDLCNKYESDISDKESEIESSNTKINELEDLCSKYESDISDKESELESSNARINELTDLCSEYESDISDKNTSYAKLNESYNDLVRQLDDTNNQYDNKLAELEESANKQKASLVEKSRELESELQETSNQLKDSQLEIDRLTDEVTKINAELDDSLEDYNQLVDNYNLVIDENQKLKDFYIEQKASKIGMSSDTIKQRLPEGYTLTDIDSIMESLFSTKRKVNMLPIMTPKFRTNQEAIMKTSSRDLDESVNSGGLSVARSMLQQMK